MNRMLLVLGNKAYSSWSLRGWWLAKMSGLPFDEIVIPLRRDDTRKQILAHSPSGKVPALQTPDGVIWDSLAIAEYLAEFCPEAGIWPAERKARALARSLCAEMHAGFAELRRAYPMAVLENHRDYAAALEPNKALRQDIARIIEIWESCRAAYRGAGEYLFGSQCAADAFFAPVASRFATYAVELPPLAAAYSSHLLASPLMVQWTDEARSEPWEIKFF